MPKGTKQKQKLYILGQIMLERTDDTHYLTLSEIKNLLEKEGVTADRKTLYDDLQELSFLGLKIDGEKNGRSYRYHVIGKEFELPELKLLVDSVQSSKFITERKSQELINKITKLSSRYEASQLKRQVHVRGRIKSMNESIYYVVDMIHNAINQDKCIHFDYYRWNIKGQLEKRPNPTHTVSPWALTWDDENYYLIGVDLNDGKEKHFRVDKIKNLDILDQKREGLEQFKGYNLAVFSKMSFGMYGGKHEKVTLRFKEGMVGALIDRFGKDIPILHTKQPEWYETVVDVMVSPQFYGWLYGLGSDVRLAGPKHVVNEWKERLEETSKLY